MPDEIKPALTAEEWRVINTGHGVSRNTEEAGSNSENSRQHLALGSYGISRNTEEGRWDGEPPFTDYGFRVSGHPSGWMYVGRYDADSRPGGGGWRMLAQVEIRRPDERHMLAAVALQRQPFGFAHEDVGWLRYLGEDRFGDPEWGPEQKAWARDLAARIAALLPPEESHA